MNYSLRNETLLLQFDDLGAELISISDNKTQTQYLWNADQNYWKRHSPILFPVVGSLSNKAYQYKDTIYPMSQHGFARDRVFQLIKQNDNEIWFSLESDEDTLKVYPFLFRLEIGYLLSGNTINVCWRVINRDLSVIHFSIGGHPAFNCPLHDDESQIDYFLRFDTKNPIRYQHIDENGLLIKKPAAEQNKLSVDDGILPLNPHLFDYDALIFEDNQCQRISILSPERIPYITLTFDTPIFGLWSPAGKNAPFICIEPWYGRCDAIDFNGSLEEREWGNKLLPGEVFEKSYTIEIHPID